MFRRKRIPENEWADRLEARLRELGPERPRAEALLARMTPTDRRRTEEVLIKTGAEHWERIERVMLRFGELAPPADEVQAPPPGPASVSRAGETYEEQRARANRALGR